jgi:hypothetical protein
MFRVSVGPMIHHRTIFLLQHEATVLIVKIEKQKARFDKESREEKLE